MQLSQTTDVVSILSFHSYWRKGCFLEHDREWRMSQPRLYLEHTAERGTVTL